MSNYSEITEYLLVGTTPDPADYNVISDQGVSLVINMRGDRRASSNIIRTKWVPWLDIRFIPIPPRLLFSAAKLSHEVIANNGKVYVYCKMGRHRSVVMAAAILIAQGYDSREAIQLIKSKRPEADPDAGYIRKSILNFERYWIKEQSK